jgi:hypothetical protein
MKRSLANCPAFAAPQTSTIVPAPIAIAADPKNPQKKRQIKCVAKFCAAPAPPAKAIMLDEVTRYNQRRPINSERGARIRGPNAKPNMYSVPERRAAVVLTLNSVIKAEVAGTVTVAANVLQLIMTRSVGVYYLLRGLFKTYIKKAKKQGTAV